MLDGLNTGAFTGLTELQASSSLKNLSKINKDFYFTAQRRVLVYFLLVEITSPFTALYYQITIKMLKLKVIQIIQGNRKC